MYLTNNILVGAYSRLQMSFFQSIFYVSIGSIFYSILSSVFEAFSKVFSVQPLCGQAPTWDDDQAKK